jgi:tRNA threonylcarbamoyladenosine biosynthesis protein TsaE
VIDNQSKKILCISAKQTESLGEKIGKRLRGGEVIELSSDLGGGKTTFVRGLARGAGSKDNISSPSFTIKNVYSAPRYEIWHFDFYRLNQAGMVGYELEDALGDSKIITVIEWAKDASKVLPEERLKIQFTPSPDESRELTIRWPEKLEYLVREL